MPDLKILTSHPVQYHVPFFRAIINEGLDIEVGYYHLGAAGQIAHDAGFGLDFAWDIDLLSGYSYRVFNNAPNCRTAHQIKVSPRLLTWVLSDRKTPLLLVGWFAEIVWLIWLLRCLLRAPTLVMSENTPLSFAARPKPAWRIALLRWLLRHAAAGLFIGSRNYAFLTGLGMPAQRLFYTPYSVDNVCFANEAVRLVPQRQNLCDQYGLNAGLPTFLFCGKLIPKKRPIELLDAYLAAGLQEQAQLLYVGDGLLRPELELKICRANLKHVHLLGFLNQTQMPLAYVLGELLCLISDPTETWGLVVNEALACGRPAIISDTVGCGPDLVGPENGWIVPLDNQDRLTQTLLTALEQRSAWAEMGKAGREKVKMHTFAVMAAGVKSALQAIQGT